MICLVQINTNQILQNSIMKSHLQPAGFHQSSAWVKRWFNFTLKQPWIIGQNNSTERFQNSMTSCWNLTAFGRCSVGWAERLYGVQSSPAQQQPSNCKIALEYLVYQHDVIWIGFNWHVSFTLWLEMAGAGYGFIKSLALCLPVFAEDKVVGTLSAPKRKHLYGCIWIDVLFLHLSLSSGASSAPLVVPCFPSAYINALCHAQ